MSNSLCRWGFLGTAAISRKNWQAVCLAENATLVAVASREIPRSSSFVDQCQAVVPFDQPPQAIVGCDNLHSAIFPQSHYPEQPIDSG